MTILDKLFENSNNIVSYCKRNIKAFLILILILILVISGLFIYFSFRSAARPLANSSTARPKGTEYSYIPVCTTEANINILEDAAGAIYRYDLATLTNAVMKIQKLPNYRHDPNCLYALVEYYIDTNQPNLASTYYVDLQHEYQPNVGFSTVYVDPLSLATLKMDIAGASESAQQNQKGLVTFPGSKK